MVKVIVEINYDPDKEQLSIRRLQAEFKDTCELETVIADKMQGELKKMVEVIDEYAKELEKS